MVREICQVLYVCDICGEGYEDYTEAAECERRGLAHTIKEGTIFWVHNVPGLLYVYSSSIHYHDVHVKAISTLGWEYSLSNLGEANAVIPLNKYMMDAVRAVKRRGFPAYYWDGSKSVPLELVEEGTPCDLP